MSFIDRYCPETIADCLRMFLVHFGKKAGKKRKTQSGGIDQLEEEEFQFTPSNKFNHQENKQVNISAPKEPQKAHEEQEENLSFKMNLHPQAETEHQETSKLFQQQGQSSHRLTHFNFKLNLEPYDQYYPLIQSKTKNLQQIFHSATKNILSRTSKSHVNIQEIETITGFKMIISYRLPCSYAYFKTINRSLEAVSKLNSVISHNKILQTIHSNLTINYLSFKKFMLLEPRFFNYIKYENSTHNFHWEICSSIKGRPETEPTEKQCELTSISCFEERKDDLIVNTYLQVDLKSNLRASKVVLRVYNQLATYLDNLFDYLAENYRHEQA